MEAQALETVAAETMSAQKQMGGTEDVSKQEGLFSRMGEALRTNSKVHKAAAALAVVALGGQAVSENALPLVGTQDAEGKASAQSSTQSRDKHESENSEYNLAGKKTVNAVSGLNIHTKSQRVQALKVNMGTHQNLGLDNTHKKQNAMPNNTSKNKLMVAAGAAMASDNAEGEGYSLNAINFRHGKAQTAHTGLTNAEKERYNERFMTKTEGAKTYVRHNVDGWFENSSMTDGGKLASKVQYFNNQDILVHSVKGKSGQTMKQMWKIEKDDDGRVCLNLVRPVTQRLIVKQPSIVRKVNTSTTSTSTSTPVPTPPGIRVVTPTPTPQPQPRTPQPSRPPKPFTPPPKQRGGKDHTQSPVVSDPNYPDEARRPNIPAPAKAIQPVGSPVKDPYKGPNTVQVPIGKNPNNATQTPAAGQDNNGTVSAP